MTRLLDFSWTCAYLKVWHAISKSTMKVHWKNRAPFDVGVILWKLFRFVHIFTLLNQAEYPWNLVLVVAKRWWLIRRLLHRFFCAKFQNLAKIVSVACSRKLLYTAIFSTRTLPSSSNEPSSWYSDHPFICDFQLPVLFYFLCLCRTDSYYTQQFLSQVAM